MATELDEYGRDGSTLPEAIPRPLVTDTKRPVLPLVKQTEAVLTDSRMGRKSQ